MAKLVRLWKRPCKRGREFKYVLIWYDEQGKERWQSLSHADSRKAERQRIQKERELHMGMVEPSSMLLSEFLRDSLERTQGQVQENTLQEYSTAMRQFIDNLGDVDLCNVRHEHGEQFIQACQSRGNRPATVKKKMVALKRLFKLAVHRGQLDENPLQHIRLPKIAKSAIHVFSDEECTRMIEATRESKIGAPFRWDLFILTAICTGMRRGELLNTIWSDIDFERQIIRICPKDETEYTWKWCVKDTDRRSVPLTKEILFLLAQHQEEQPDGYPYVFMTPKRYDYIQDVRRQGKWSARQRNCPHGNFRRQFLNILSRAGIEQGKFHDLRRTCLTNWFFHGLSEYDVMKVAGHSRGVYLLFCRNFGNSNEL